MLVSCCWPLVGYIVGVWVNHVAVGCVVVSDGVGLVIVVVYNVW